MDFLNTNYNAGQGGEEEILRHQGLHSNIRFSWDIGKIPGVTWKVFPKAEPNHHWLSDQEGREWQKL